METAWQRNMKRHLPPLQARQPQRAETAEVWRDKLMSEVETLIAAYRQAGLEDNAVEALQQVKLLKLQNRAQWWIDRKGWSATMLLRRPV